MLLLLHILCILPLPHMGQGDLLKGVLLHLFLLRVGNSAILQRLLLLPTKSVGVVLSRLIKSRIAFYNTLIKLHRSLYTQIKKVKFKDTKELNL